MKRLRLIAPVVLLALAIMACSFNFDLTGEDSTPAANDVQSETTASEATEAPSSPGGKAFATITPLGGGVNNAGPVSLKIENQSTWNVCYVFLSSNNSSTWGLDVLPEDKIIEEGESYAIQIDQPGVYDVKLETCNSLRLVEAYGMELYSDSRLSVPEPEILYSDSFDDPQSGWYAGSDETGTVKYSDEKYSIHAVQYQEMVGGSGTESITDGSILASAKVNQQPESRLAALGTVCRIQPGGDGYFFSLRLDGYFAIAKRVNGEMLTLLDWTEIEDFYERYDPAEEVIIEANCEGDTLEFYVNGDYLGSVEDDKFSSGKIGLYAYTLADAPLDVQFDYVLVTKPIQ